MHQYKEFYWDARFLMSLTPSNGRPLEEEEKVLAHKTERIARL
jgi:hypothetical protein